MRDHRWSHHMTTLRLGDRPGHRHVWHCKRCGAWTYTTSTGVEPKKHHPHGGDLKRTNTEPDCDKRLVEGVHRT